ncbi:MAG: TMEM175 family protein [Phormidesmis sp.]
MSNNAASNDRLNTLIDGIFAIVLTLLVLDIKVPELASEAALAEQLVDLWPQFFSYGLSFIILGLFWLGHQLASRCLCASDDIHIWLSLLFMMFIALVPFSSSLLGAYNNSRVAVVVYSSNIFAASLLRYVHWRYVSSHNRLIDKRLSAGLVAAVSRAFLSTPLLCLVAIALSLVSTKLSLILLTIALTNILLRIGRLFRHRAI